MLSANAARMLLYEFTAICLIAACASCTEVKRLDNGITVVEEPTTASSISVHGSRRPVLLINGIRYADVQGCSPYFVHVLGTNAIVFVIERPKGAGGRYEGDAIHYFDLNTGSDKLFVTREPGAGHYIGFTNALKKTEAMLIDNSRLVLTYFLPDIQKTWLLNLASNTVDQVSVELNKQ